MRKFFLLFFMSSLVLFRVVSVFGKEKRILILPFRNIVNDKRYIFLEDHIPSSIFLEIFRNFNVEYYPPKEYLKEAKSYFGEKVNVRAQKKILSFGKRLDGDFVIAGEFEIDKKNFCTINAYLYSVKDGKLLKKYMGLKGEGGKYIYELIDKLATMIIKDIKNYVPKRKKVLTKKELKKIIKKKEEAKRFSLELYGFLGFGFNPVGGSFVMENLFSDLQGINVINKKKPENSIRVLGGIWGILYRRFVVSYRIEYLEITPFYYEFYPPDNSNDLVKVLYQKNRIISPLILGGGYLFNFNKINVIPMFFVGFGLASFEQLLLTNDVVTSPYEYVSVKNSPALIIGIEGMGTYEVYKNVFLVFGINLSYYRIFSIKGKDDTDSTSNLYKLFSEEDQPAVVFLFASPEYLKILGEDTGLKVKNDIGSVDFTYLGFYLGASYKFLWFIKKS